MRVVGIILSFLLLAGCKDYSFGDDAKTFVAQDAYKSSKGLLTADLNNRWPNYFYTSVVTLSNDLREIAALVPDPKQAVTAGSADTVASSAVENVVYTDSALVRVSRAQSLLAELQKRFAATEGICSDQKMFFRLGIDKIAIVSPLGSLQIPPHELKIYLSTSSGDGSSGNQKDSSEGDADFWASLGDSIVSLFGQSQYDTQMKRLHEAERDFPSHVVQVDEAFKISQSICTQSLKSDQPQFDRLNSAITQMAALLPAAEKGLRSLDDSAVAQLSPQLISAALQTNGAYAALDQWRTKTQKGQIALNLPVVIADVEQEYAGALKLTDCLSLAEKMEDLGDYASDAIGEVKLAEASVDDADLLRRLSAAEQKLTADRLSFISSASSRRRHLCGI